MFFSFLGRHRTRQSGAIPLAKMTRSALTAIFLLGSSCSPLLLAQDSPSPTNPGTKPAARIELSAIGYHEPSRMERLSEDMASVSLNFLDADHVLLTFNPKKLFQRLPGCPPSHDDRLVHAAVLEVPSGKVVKEADWYLHDHRRYLWPLGAGQLLLRKGNDLYVVDSSLTEKLLLASSKDLLWATATPDESQIVVETAQGANPAKNSQPESPQAPAKTAPKFVVEFLDAKTMAPQRTIQLNEMANLDGTSSGYVDAIHKGDLWLIRFGPNPAQRHNITRVRSRTVPTVFYSSGNSFLVGRCAAAACDYSVTSFTVTGHRLWRQHWSQYRKSPVVARSEDNTRFGVSTLGRTADTASAQPADDAENGPDVTSDGLQQQVQIFETASGNPVLSITVNPPLLSGQNFSLSPDGRRLALLQGSGVELFDLPPSSEEEHAKFLALKADVLRSYTVGATPDSDAPPDSTTAEHPAPEETTPAAADAPPATAAENRDDSNSTVDTGKASHPSPPADASIPSSPTPAPAATGQSGANRGEPVTTFKVSTKAVVVDVVVTDAKGHAIKGLRQEDFQLLEDGKPQNVSYFREFDDANVPAAAANVPSAPLKLSPNVFSNHTSVPDPGSVTLVLFDLLNTPTADQEYARQQLIKFLAAKPRNSELALCTMGAGTPSLRLIQGFTLDENLLLAAAKGKKGSPRSVHWQTAAAGTGNVVDTVSDLARGGPTSGFQGLLRGLQGMQAEQQITDTDERVAITIDSLMLLARYLAGIPGRKNVVWLSGSFPVSMVTDVGSGNLSLENRNYADKIKGVTNLLAEAQIAVYPVDVRGLLGIDVNAGGAMAPMGGPSSSGPDDFSATSITSSSGFRMPQGLAGLAQASSERDTLLQFAAATGGKAFYNSNGIQDAIATAVEQGSNFYTLSYSPANKLYNGKFRKIKVLLAQKGYTLHYRQGYFADDPGTAARDVNLSRRTRAAAMQYGSPPSRQLLFSAKVVPLGSKKKVDRAKITEVFLASAKKPVLPAMVEVQHYGIDYTFQTADLRFAPGENATYRSVLVLMVASFDSEGRMLTGVSDLGTNNLEAAVYKDLIGGELSVHQEVDVPVEAGSLRLGIQDQMGNHIGTVEVPLPVPPPPYVPRRLRHPLPEIEPD